MKKQEEKKPSIVRLCLQFAETPILKKDKSWKDVVTVLLILAFAAFLLHLSDEFVIRIIVIVIKAAFAAFFFSRPRKLIFLRTA